MKRGTNTDKFSEDWARYLILGSRVVSCLIWVILKDEKISCRKPAKVNYLEVAKLANR